MIIYKENKMKILCLIILMNISLCCVGKMFHAHGMEDFTYHKIPVVTETTIRSLGSDISVQVDIEQTKLTKALQNLPSDTALDVEMQEPDYNITYPKNTQNKLTQTILSANKSAGYWEFLKDETRNIKPELIALSLSSFLVGVITSASILLICNNS